ncbi:MAG: toxin [Chloroflexi bacterium]|nr:toxin [Chloroflexota bacterium]
MKTIRWNVGKNEKLKRERRVTFEEVVYHIEQGDVIDITQHPNQEKYPGQQIYVIQMHDYIHLVPFIETDDEIFLKTYLLNL